MIFHYAGKYDGDESKLPQKEHHPHAVQFKELENTKKLSLIANIGGCVNNGFTGNSILVTWNKIYS